MRKKFNFSNDWKTISHEELEESQSSIFHLINEKKKFEEICNIVNLPHSNSIQPLNASGGRNKQNVCWYFKEIPDFTENYKKLIIEFEGIMMESQFYINGKLVHTHKCGYTPAVFDLKPYLREENNSVLIRVSNEDNNLIPPGKLQRELDYNYDGGIYREAWITGVEKVHFSHPILANKVSSGGIYCTTLNSSPTFARIKILSNIDVLINDNSAYTILHSLFDKEDKLVASCESKYIQHDSFNVDLENILEVVNPHLWSPNNPYTYKLQSNIIDDLGNNIDSISTLIGIRNFDIDYTKGFSINQTQMKVSGGNYHQSFGQLGNAVPNNLLRRDARKLKLAGFDHIRTHYPPAEAFIDECDKIGLMLTISNPGWQYFEEGEFEIAAYNNMRTIIRWLRNHPSIIIWEANLNESNMTDQFMKKMQALVHEELPFGDIYTGSHSHHSDVLYTNIDPDMIFNDLQQTEHFEAKSTWVREYGDNPDNWSDQNTVWRTRRKWGEHLMLRQVNRIISSKYDWMTSYTDMYNSNLVSGFGLWPSIEYNRGYHMNPCYGGLLDLQRVPKYSYYFMQSQRDIDLESKSAYNSPILFIANSCTEYAPDDITVYTNCDYAKLYYNNTYISTEYPINTPINHPPIVFDGSFRLARNRSVIKIEGFVDNQVVISKEITSHGVARKLNITIDDENIEFSTHSDDVVVLHVEALDDLGNRVIYGCDEYDIKVTSNNGAEIVGDYVKQLEMGITSFLLRGCNNDIEIKIDAVLDIEQPYEEISVKPAHLTIPKFKEQIND